VGKAKRAHHCSFNSSRSTDHRLIGRIGVGTARSAPLPTLQRYSALHRSAGESASVHKLDTAKKKRKA